MYAHASKIKGLPVISLQTGEAVAWVQEPVIEISSFDILAFLCDSPGHKRSLVLMAPDVRQLAADCVIVDSEDELVERNDIIRLQATLKANYTPLGKSVVSDLGRKLGAVEDYSINLETAQIQQLHLKPSLFRSWLGTKLTVDRTQIIDVTPRRIVVRDVAIKTPILQPDTLPEINT